MRFVKLSMIVLISGLILSGCAGIRFCGKDESVKSGCQPWDPATRSGGSVRS